MDRTIVQRVKSKLGRNLENARSYDFAKSASEGIHIVHTSTAATSVLLRAAEGFLADTQATIHIHAALPIPYHLELDNPLISVPVIERAIGDCVRISGSPARTYAVRVYGCRGRLEGLLQRLPPASLVLFAYHWRPWPTAESKLANALEAAGHHVISVHTNKQQVFETNPTRIGMQEQDHACSSCTPTPTR